MLRITFVSDLQASKKCYIKLLNSVNYYKSDVLIAGADITGKFLIPVVKGAEGYTYTYRGNRNTVSEEKLQVTLDALRGDGIYAAVVTQEEFDELSRDPSKVDKLFLESMKNTLAEWAELARQRLAGKNLQLILNFGNDDRMELDAFARTIENDYFVFSEDRKFTLGNEYTVVSTGYANVTPWNAPRDISEDELEKRIDEKVSDIRDFEKVIFNFHCPPLDTVLDKAPRLGADNKPIATGGHMQMESVGSSAVRKALEKYQPLLGLHGHIHESRGFTKIGRTVCLNPGSEYHNGVLKLCIITLDGSKVKDHIFLDG
jgi:hypothetical protein